MEEHVGQPMAGSLLVALASVPDPRSAHGRRHPLGAILALAVCGMLCGSRSLYAMAQWGRDQDSALAHSLGFTRDRTPCVSTLHEVFSRLDRERFEEVLGQWFQEQGLKPEEGLSVDGKTLRGIHGEEIPGVHLVSAYAGQAGAVLAQMAAPGKGGELAAVKGVLAQVPLWDRVVTGDALLTQREVCQQVVADGGDYLLPVKKNQPSLRRDLELAFSPSSGDAA